MNQKNPLENFQEIQAENVNLVLDSSTAELVDKQLFLFQIPKNVKYFLFIII